MKKELLLITSDKTLFFTSNLIITINCIMLFWIKPYMDCPLCTWLGYLLPCIGFVMLLAYAFKELNKEPLDRKDNYKWTIIYSTVSLLIALAVVIFFA